METQILVTPSELSEYEQRVLRVLARGPSAKEELCRAANLKRWRGHVTLARLEVQQLISWVEDGPAKVYKLTELGERVLATLGDAD